MLLEKSSGIFLPNEHIDIEFIKADLTIQQQLFNSTEYQTLNFYEEMNGGILIPRFYPVKGEVEDINNEGLDIRIESNIVPDGKTQEDAIEWLSTTDKGILKALPGMGKTVCAIESICRRKKKTIIIVHKKDLISQWIKEILQFTSLTEDDIGILTTNKKKFQQELDKPILLTTPHVIGIALKQNKYYFIQALKECGIGVMIVDEVHAIIGAAMFSKSSISVPVKVVIGLSATPERPDESNKILTYHLGDIKEFKTNTEDIVIPNIAIMRCNFEIHSSNPRYINFGGFFQMPKYCNQSKKSKKYTGMVLYIINKSYNEGRNILVVGDYISHLLFFAEHCEVKREDIGFFTPTADKKDVLKVTDFPNGKEAFLKQRVIFSTFKAVRDGNNRKNLDCVILLTPCNNPIQMIGRITRKLEGKKVPLAFDLVDTDPTVKKVWNEDKTEKISKFEKAYLKRLEIYKSQNWNIKVFEK